jgi:hypothetical protein
VYYQFYPPEMTKTAPYIGLQTQNVNKLKVNIQNILEHPTQSSFTQINLRNLYGVGIYNTTLPRPIKLRTRVSKCSPWTIVKSKNFM